MAKLSFVPEFPSSSRFRHAPAHAPGASPLHVKGVLYRATQEYFRDQVQGGLESLYAELAGEPEILEFIQQPFLAGSWYDVLPVATLIHAEARAMRLPLASYLRVRARYQAESDIHGVYRFLLKLVSPDSVAMRLPRLMAQMLDFGTTESKLVEPGHAELTMRGFPAALTDWYTFGFNVYADVAIRLAGAKKVTVTIHPSQPEPSRDGIPMVTINMEARYA